MRNLAALATILALQPIPARADPAAAPLAPLALRGVAHNVSDLARSLRFYRDGLGMTVQDELGPPERHETFLSLGNNVAAPLVVLVSGPGRRRPRRRSRSATAGW